MKKENQKKQKLELEILELENKIAPAVEGSTGGQANKGNFPYEGAEC